ncbi:30S ribosome-binding factor RbfA [Spiroplasma endosymbiont of Amphibalanus improvisus]|uniref:30S ribosome-binding factor RbfA n=1 Tax=Spiroplasma endosymbiont of Amphibalanus improvisus TaxID=3066327 RepID=UPI00313B3FBE
MNNSVKHDRLQSLITRDLILIMQREIKNEIVNALTVHEVRLSGDNSIAKIYFSFLPTNGSNTLEVIKKELEKCRKIIRAKLASKIQIRKCPDLVFKYDESFDAAKRIEDILEKNKTEN